jgi:protein-L-isoaspartate(D-aspartate) O-methyltransferase
MNYRKIFGFFLFAFLLSVLLTTAGMASEDFARERQAMLDEIIKDVRDRHGNLEKPELDRRVIEALQKVPRHEFVPDDLSDVAYENRPLPIGFGQTISQPYIVAIMTDLLQVRPNFKVLEVGTGSGYQAAVLAELVDKVYSIEIIEPLGKLARERLERLAYKNVELRIGDGYYGWEKAAPFDAIIVTAAASHIPPPLIKQLKPGGRMIIPVGSRFMVQELLLVEKDQEGKVTTRQLLPVDFVPLTGKH